ncbi:hypothetical protein AALO_G00011020 [Alosa alosa]|uniref:Chemokine interleukin-8-like domain-containing protein n=1 Tax=Alosa alosa TaxID=278164 RepID=A0AAV6HJN2_9TELE|nr:hypothetical protein AALO_G00011020 [Alosa alosa]
MQLLRPFVGSLAIITILLSLTVLETVTGEKPLSCCTMVSTKKVTAPITGFRFQKKNLPCVAAVIFETTEGPFCSRWQEKWVQEIIRSIRQKQNLLRTTSASPKSVVPSARSSISNSTAAATQSLSSHATATSTIV